MLQGLYVVSRRHEALGHVSLHPAVGMRRMEQLGMLVRRAITQTAAAGLAATSPAAKGESMETFPSCRLSQRPANPWHTRARTGKALSGEGPARQRSRRYQGPSMIRGPRSRQEAGLQLAARRHPWTACRGRRRGRRACAPPHPPSRAFPRPPHLSQGAEQLRQARAGTRHWRGVPRG